MTVVVPTTRDGMDYDGLRRACWHLAHSLLSLDGNDVTARCSSLAIGFEADALSHLQYLLESDRDPNLLTAAVRFLGSHIAIPPMVDDPRWFSSAMTVLVELACPNGAGDPSESPLYREIGKGLAAMEADAHATDESEN